MKFWTSAKRDAATQEQKIRMVNKIRTMFPGFTWYFPAYKDAPWHVKARCEKTMQTVDLWPHLGKAHYAGTTATSKEKIVQLFEQAEAFEDEDVVDDFDVFEDYEPHDFMDPYEDYH